MTLEMRACLTATYMARAPTQTDMITLLGYPFDVSHLDLGSAGRTHATPCLHKHMLQVRPSKQGYTLTLIRLGLRSHISSDTIGQLGQLTSSKRAKAGTHHTAAARDQATVSPGDRQARTRHAVPLSEASGRLVRGVSSRQCRDRLSPCSLEGRMSSRPRAPLSPHPAVPEE